MSPQKTGQEPVRTDAADRNEKKPFLSGSALYFLLFGLVFFLALSVLLTAYLSAPPMRLKPVDGESGTGLTSSGPELSGAAESGSAALPAFVLNLNTAARAELEQLPGIGSTTAGKIIAYREEHGGFTKLTELLEVEGIGVGTLREIEPYLTLASPGASGGDSSGFIHAPVNVNTAEPGELALLPGIGERLAERIVQYRTEHGPFHWIEELLEVDGIGEKLLAELEPLITLGDYAAKSEYVCLPVNLNTASRDELMKVPGIGESTADRILAYRDEIGRFTSLRQLLNIPGIGEKKLSDFENYLAIESPSLHERESSAESEANARS